MGLASGGAFLPCLFFSSSEHFSAQVALRLHDHDCMAVSAHFFRGVDRTIIWAWDVLDAIKAFRCSQILVQYVLNVPFQGPAIRKCRSASSVADLV